MLRISLYMNGDLYEKVRSQAKEKGMSMSGYVRCVLNENFNGWPKSFLDTYFGAMKNDPLEEPEELPWESDAHRDKLIDESAEWPDSLPEDLTLPTIPFRSRRSPPEE